MHSHHHHHADNNHDNGSTTRIGWAFFLNVGFTIIEFIGGLLTNSTAIMADAVHDLGDSLSIGLAWVLARLSQKDPTDTFSYGYRRFSLLGALINGLVLLAGSAWVISEAIPRLFNPIMPVAEGMLLLSLFGMAVNGFAAYKLSRGKTLNEQILNWHLIEDVMGWVAVFIVALVLMFFHWPILDPILSIAFTLFILFNVLKTLRRTVGLFLQAVPDKQRAEDITKVLLGIQGIESIHHLHFWSLDGESHVLTAHVVLAATYETGCQLALKQHIEKMLLPFSLAHTTIEMETHQELCRDR